jgi:hypothetical protein
VAPHPQLRIRPAAAIARNDATGKIASRACGRKRGYVICSRRTAPVFGHFWPCSALSLDGRTSSRAQEIRMTKPQEKAKGRVKQAVGQIVGNDHLVLEGKKQERQANRDSDDKQPSEPKKKTGIPPNAEASEQTVDPTGRKGPVLD